MQLPGGGPGWSCPERGSPQHQVPASSEVAGATAARCCQATRDASARHPGPQGSRFLLGPCAGDPPSPSPRPRGRLGDPPTYTGTLPPPAAAPASIPGDAVAGATRDAAAGGPHHTRVIAGSCPARGGWAGSRSPPGGLPPVTPGQLGTDCAKIQPIRGGRACPTCRGSRRGRGALMSLMSSWWGGEMGGRGAGQREEWTRMRGRGNGAGGRRGMSLGGSGWG